jgi:hypothetical protein
MSEPSAVSGAASPPLSQLRSLRTPRFGTLQFAAVGLVVLLIAPAWIWPFVATQDGPSHLYNAEIVRESLAGDGPSTAVYEVAWKPLPNWVGTLFVVGLLKILPLSLVPRVMLTITGVAPILAMLCLRRQIGRPLGVAWIVAFVGCLATGRAWDMGFESFMLGTAAAIAAVALYVRFCERLDPPRALAVVAMLALTFFCHPVPWAFAVVAIAVFSLAGSGRGRRWLWTAAILLTAVPFFVSYQHLAYANAEGMEFDWNHLKGFHWLGIRSWVMLIGRADCLSVMKHVIPFSNSGSVGRGRVTRFVVSRVLLDPFVLMAGAILLQAAGTFVRDARARDYRRLGWGLLGIVGVIVALFIPDGTAQNGSFLPFRAMLFSLILLAAYVRFDLNRRLTIGTSLLVGIGFAMHLAAICDYAVSADRQIREVQTAAATISPDQRIYQIGTRERHRFESDAGLHSDAYTALWSRGILLSNYEAAFYYFPVKLRPDYPRVLVTQIPQMQELDPKQKSDRDRLRKFLADYERFIDVLIVRSRDRQIVAVAQEIYGDVLWHNDQLWVLKHRAPTQISGLNRRGIPSASRAIASAPTSRPTSGEHVGRDLAGPTRMETPPNGPSTRSASSTNTSSSRDTPQAAARPDSTRDDLR